MIKRNVVDIKSSKNAIKDLEGNYAIKFEPTHYLHAGTIRIDEANETVYIRIPKG